MLLRIENLQAGYGRFPVLRGVDLKVEAGSIVVLIGSNGAGKSTISKSIFGVTEIHQGTILFKEQNLAQVARHDLIRLGVDYVPQGRMIFPNLIVRENLLMGGLILDDDLLPERLGQVLADFPHWRKKLNLTADLLSGGEQQILALGRGLISDPELLLLDEPSLGLAPKIQQEIFEKIVEIKSRGIAVLLVEQNAKKTYKIADKIYLLESERIVLEGDRDILDHPLIKKMYLGG